MRRPSQRDLQLEVENWNLKHDIRTAVRVTKDDGTQVDTHTTSEAYMLSGHTPVVHVAGISGCYLLSRVKPIKVPA